MFFAWPPCILRKFLQFEAESWPAPRRRLFELPVFRTEIRGFFAATYENKEYQQTLFKIQISSPTVFTTRMRKIDFGAKFILAPNPTMAAVFTAPKCMQALGLSVSNKVGMNDC